MLDNLPKDVFDKAISVWNELYQLSYNSTDDKLIKYPSDEQLNNKPHELDPSEFMDWAIEEVNRLHDK